MVQLAQKLAQLAMTEIEWVNFEKCLSSKKEGEDKANVYYVLELKDVIEFVQGYSTVPDPNNRGKEIPVVAEEVVEIRVNHSIIEKYQDDFIFDEDENGNFTRTGRYKGDLFLDVAKTSGYVWLVDDKFSNYGSEQRKSSYMERNNNFASILLKRKNKKG